MRCSDAAIWDLKRVKVISVIQVCIVEWWVSEQQGEIMGVYSMRNV